MVGDAQLIFPRIHYRNWLSGLLGIVLLNFLLPTTLTREPAAAQTVLSPSFIGLSPARLLDTRSGIGAPATPLGTGAAVDLHVLGVGGLPSSGVGSVAINVTAVAPSEAGWITVWPAGQPQPNTSNVNFVRGQTVPNMVVVTVGTGGTIRIANSIGNTHVLVDVTGYFPTGAGYTGITPTRMLDTRTGLGNGLAQPMTGGNGTGFRAGGVGLIPANATSVVMNVTVTNPTATGYITVWPVFEVQPTVSNVNFSPGQTVANLVVSAIGVGGQIAIYNSAGNTDVVVDVAGYFVGNTNLVRVPPKRLMDTRSGTGAVAGSIGTGSSVDIQVTGQPGVPTSGVGSVILNVTVPNRQVLAISLHGRPEHRFQTRRISIM
jgi:hypothetical protein